MKRTLFLMLSVFLAAENVWAASADEELITPEIERAVAGSNQAMEESLQNMNRTLEKVMPEVAQTMSESMAQILGSLAPVMKAMEENGTFSKAASQMAREIEKNISEINASVLQNKTNAPARQMSGEKTPADNDIPSVLPGRQSVSAPQNAPDIPAERQNKNALHNRITAETDSRALKFTLEQDSELAAALTDYMDRLRGKTETAGLALRPLTGRDIPLSACIIEKINGSPFLICDCDKEKMTYLTGVTPDGFCLRLQTFGRSHKKEARKFAGGLPQNGGAAEKITLFPQN